MAGTGSRHCPRNVRRIITRGLGRGGARGRRDGSQLWLRPPRDAGAVLGVRYNPTIVKRIFRILLNAATVLSLLLGVATVVLWVRGRSIGDTFVLRRTTGSTVRTTTFAQLWSSGGGLRLMIGGMRADWGALPPVLPPEPGFAHGSYDPGPLPYPIDRSGSGSTARFGGEFE